MKRNNHNRNIICADSLRIYLFKTKYTLNTSKSKKGRGIPLVETF